MELIENKKYSIEYDNVDISSYLNAREKDHILYCGKLHRVRKLNSGSLYIKFCIYDGYGNRVEPSFLLRDLIYKYYNKINIPENTKIINIDNNPDNNDINNLRLIKINMTEDDLKDYDFIYNNFDIRECEHVKIDDYITYCGKPHQVIKESGSDNKPVICIRMIDSKKMKNYVKYIPIKNIVYCYYNGLLLDKNIKIINIDNDFSNNKIENLKKIYINIPEKLLNDYEFIYKNNNIEYLEKTKNPQYVIFCDKTYGVINKNGKNKTIPGIMINVISDDTGEIYKMFIPIKNIVYNYYNKFNNISNNGMIVINLDNDLYNNHISNLKMVHIITTDVYDNWNIKYDGVDIETYINAVNCDKILLFGRYYKVSINDEKRLIVHISIKTGNNTIVKSVRIYRLIYEYYNRCLLDESIDIHHIDGDYSNNKITNLLALTRNEHCVLHNIVKHNRILKNDYNDFYNNIIRYAEILNGYKQDNFISYDYNTVSTSFSVEDLENINPYKGFEDFCNFK